MARSEKAVTQSNLLAGPARQFSRDWRCRQAGSAHLGGLAPAPGKSAKERCPQNRYRDLNPHSPKDALSSGAAFEIQIIAISSLPWIGESRSIPLGNAGAPFSDA